MTTTIDTTPAGGLQINDTNNADTITVADGPAENGFQTTQVATATNTTIFANKTFVVIDGGNHGDSVVLNNPDPAAGWVSLNVQNLGGTGTINGSNPNASGPDIAVAAETLFAGGGIGTTRALRTQASALSVAAGLGGAGNIHVSNGVTTPVTVNIGVLQAQNAAGGTITFTNNGTINDTSSQSDGRPRPQSRGRGRTRVGQRGHGDHRISRRQYPPERQCLYQQQPLGQHISNGRRQFYDADGTGQLPQCSGDYQ